MKAVMFSVNRPHTDNIKIGAKTSELRTKPPKITGRPYKAYIYETFKNDGCGKVIGEFVAFNENTYRICMGVPTNLIISGCISAEEILRYTKNGEKDLTEISISDLVIYDKPKELSEFNAICPNMKPDRTRENGNCPCGKYTHDFDETTGKTYCTRRKTKPPQSWCYVEP